ncbi:MAG: methionyl-tRNA formyltransferase [Bacteroidota bacterium]
MASNKVKRDLRIVFMGTPAFAVAGLEALLANNYQVVGVVTAADKPSGRGRKLMSSAVKQFALAHQIPLLQPTNLKSPVFLEALRDLKANLQVVVAFRMLPKVVWQMPEYGTFNLHASLLPNYRGATPINWAIINGETETGVTTFFIDEHIDTGAIILKKSVAIGTEEDAGSLHDRLMVTGAQLIVATVEAIARQEAISQEQSTMPHLKPAPKIDRDTCRINWSNALSDIFNFIRGLSPYPLAWTELHNGEKILPVKIVETTKERVSHQYQIGTLIPEKSTLKVATKDGFLYLQKLQLPGKRKMAIKDVLNGFRFEEGAYMR